MALFGSSRGGTSGRGMIGPGSRSEIQIQRIATVSYAVDTNLADSRANIKAMHTIQGASKHDDLMVRPFEPAFGERAAPTAGGVTSIFSGNVWTSFGGMSVDGFATQDEFEESLFYAGQTHATVFQGSGGITQRNGVAVAMRGTGTINYNYNPETTFYPGDVIAMQPPSIFADVNADFYKKQSASSTGPYGGRAIAYPKRLSYQDIYEYYVPVMEDLLSKNPTTDLYNLPKHRPSQSRPNTFTRKQQLAASLKEFILLSGYNTVMEMIKQGVVVPSFGSKLKPAQSFSDQQRLETGVQEKLIPGKSDWTAFKIEAAAVDSANLPTVTELTSELEKSRRKAQIDEFATYIAGVFGLAYEAQKPHLAEDRFMTSAILNRTIGSCSRQKAQVLQSKMRCSEDFISHHQVVDFFGTPQAGQATIAGQMEELSCSVTERLFRSVGNAQSASNRFVLGTASNFSPPGSVLHHCS